MKCCELESNIETRSPKCKKKNIVKSMKLIISQMLLLLHGHVMNIFIAF